MSHGHQIKADEYLQYLPAAGYLVMGSIGVRAKHNFKERALVTSRHLPHTEYSPEA